MAVVPFLAVFTLAACNNNGENDANIYSGSVDHADMEHVNSGEVPEGLNEAKNPTYKLLSKAVIKANHMEGMKGAEATIVGAYDTMVYSVSYNPTNGGKRIENHKWVVHEEILNADENPFGPGDQVIIDGEHMKGMDGETAIIHSAKKATVYMVDFVPTGGEPKVTNHKWLTESEPSPKRAEKTKGT